MSTKSLLAALVLTTALSACAQATSEHKIPTEQPRVAAEAAEAANAAFSQGSNAIPAMPLHVVQAGPITYVNGGISDEELTQLKAQASQYNLQIMLSAPKGDYISNVRLRLLKKTTVLVDLADAGPYFYAQLPAGTYTLETTNPGAKPKHETIKISAKGTVKKHIIYKQ